MSDDSDNARARLREAWRVHVADDVELLERVVGRHGERHRRYHGVAHVDHVVRSAIDLGSTEGLSRDEMTLVVAAAVYHDAIYEPRSPKNEAASARLARRDLASLDWPDDAADAVGRMIDGTSTHLDPHDLASAVLFDADLAVLGGTPDAYEHYRSAVRQEYHHVADADWTTGRAEVLRGFLDRSEIYATDAGRQRWEASARQNLADELAALTT